MLNLCYYMQENKFVLYLEISLSCTDNTFPPQSLSSFSSTNTAAVAIFICSAPLPAISHYGSILEYFNLICSEYLLILQAIILLLLEMKFICVKMRTRIWYIWLDVINGKNVAFLGHNPWLRWKYFDSWARLRGFRSDFKFVNSNYILASDIGFKQ